jgi:hypothetical protein
MWTENSVEWPEKWAKGTARFRLSDVGKAIHVFDSKALSVLYLALCVRAIGVLTFWTLLLHHGLLDTI